jgi:hypothetical protein
VTPADVAQYQFTPTIAGQAKLAAAEWRALTPFLR